ncbi:hypothetical protein CRUP_031033 [Coryphaenoides rupestris]|nr:hypothetical protein CRUP_031033 [Coryphaenoides rupestris]
MWGLRGEEGLQELPSCLALEVDSTNSSENIYTMMNPIGPGGNRPNFPMGPGPDGPMGGMGSMEQHHMNGSLGSGDMDGLPKPLGMALESRTPLKGPHHNACKMGVRT